MPVIDEPAAAIAAGDCLASRTAKRPGVTSRHPGPCDWCPYPTDALRSMVEGWNTWAEPKDRGHGTVYARYDAQAFAELARRNPAEAQRLIEEARGTEPPLPPPSAPQPVEADSNPEPHGEDVTAWLT